MKESVKHPSALQIAQTKNLNGQIAIVTGGNSGLGKETARALAMAGAKVFIAVRDLEKGKIAAADIRKSITKVDGTVECAHLDLADQSSIHVFAKEIQSKVKKIDILINNAAIMALPKLTLGTRGYEAQFETNHLGHFVLTERLNSLLQNSGHARVVSLSSIGHKHYSGDFSDINYTNRPLF
jgi:NAD(P)-dependent dehydrogenase (short-subunit alcohol dehydrogenase family)